MTTTMRGRIRALCDLPYIHKPTGEPMFHLLVFRPELVRMIPPAERSPFEGIESLGLFDTETDVDREITYWQQREGRNWKFMSEPAPERPIDKWKRAAAELGEIHSKNAASWATDGNEPDESRRRRLKMIQDGDPAMDTYLPRRPDLSGEWADSYDAAKLLEEVTGRQPEDVPDEDREGIIGAWELSVDEHFVNECEKELLKWTEGKDD